MALKTLVVVLCIAVEDEVTAVELEEIVKSEEAETFTRLHS